MVGRFAPSPSGRMHLGNVFSAMLAWLSVRAAGGELVLRIEDLDPDRCRPEYAEQLKDDLLWLGLDWDREQTPQSRRSPAYAEAFDRLASAGLVYPCYCSRADLHAADAPHAADGRVLYAGTLHSGILRVDNQQRRAFGIDLNCAAVQIVLIIHGTVPVVYLHIKFPLMIIKIL